MQFIVVPPGSPGPPPAVPVRLPKTPVKRSTQTTFTAPVGDPGGQHAAGTWHAVSLGGDGEPDGLWLYERGEHTIPRWTVTYVPTGQRRGFTNLNCAGGAREATAGGLLDELRGEAFTAAFDAGADERATGQRWLAVHMRLAGHTEFDATCACGGFLVQTSDGGRLAHVDACNKCLDVPAGPCPGAGAHKFCAWPDPQLTERELRILAFEKLWWSQPGAKIVAIRRDFDGLSEMRYYAELNTLIDKPAALAAEPIVVRRLLRQRSRRIGPIAAVSPP